MALIFSVHTCKSVPYVGYQIILSYSAFIIFTTYALHTDLLLLKILFVISVSVLSLLYCLVCFLQHCGQLLGKS